MVDDAIKYAKENSQDSQEQITLACDKLFVNFGCEILKLVPGRVSTEVDARYDHQQQQEEEKGEDEGDDAVEVEVGG